MDVPIPPNSVIYCDIPYFDTNCGQYSGFDHQRFYKWLDIIDHPVFVSEYTAPPNTTEVFSIKKRVTVDMHSETQYSEEKLFIQNRYLDWYKEAKDKEPKQRTIFDELEKLNDN